MEAFGDRGQQAQTRPLLECRLNHRLVSGEDGDLEITADPFHAGPEQRATKENSADATGRAMLQQAGDALVHLQGEFAVVPIVRVQRAIKEVEHLRLRPMCVTGLLEWRNRFVQRVHQADAWVHGRPSCSGDVLGGAVGGVCSRSPLPTCADRPPSTDKSTAVM